MTWHIDEQPWEPIRPAPLTSVMVKYSQSMSVQLVLWWPSSLSQCFSLFTLVRLICVMFVFSGV